MTGVFIRSKTGLLGLVPAHPLDAKGKTPINLAKGVFPVARGGVSQQALTGSGATAESWKVMKAPPRESLSSTAVAASTAPARVSRTIVGTGNSARVVTLGRDGSIVYDAGEHRFVNGAAAPRSASATNAVKTDVAAKSAPAGERAGQVAVPGRASAGAASNMRIPVNSARSVAPPSRAMAPPPARASTGGAGAGWGGAASRGSAGASAPHSAPSASAGAAHPSSGGGRPH